MLVEMKSIVMDFGPVRAVNDVTININSGDIIGLLGEIGRFISPFIVNI